MSHNSSDRTVSYHILAKVMPNPRTFSTNKREKPNSQSDYQNSKVTVFLECLLGPLKGTSRGSSCPCMLPTLLSPPLPASTLLSIIHRAGGPSTSLITPDEDTVHEIPVINQHTVWNLRQSPMQKMLK